MSAKKDRRIEQKKRAFAPTQLIALCFAGIILLGAGLLCLPLASRCGSSCGFLPALFTATSATCVTGLTWFDTWSRWSGFGQAVILIMIELGGLGFMSLASLFVFLLRKKVGMKQRMVMAQAFSLTDMEGVVHLQGVVLKGSLLIQGTGALILFFHFLPTYGFLRALRWGVFHSVSAFCNAGFDIFGVLEPGMSLSLFHDDPVVILTLSALVILGGLGFFVWQEVVQVHNWKKFSVYTKLVLSTSAVLLVTGTVLFTFLEWNNPATLGNMPVFQKWLNGFFQSVTVRTAGFFSVDQAGLTEGSKAVSILFMLIGGCSGSTAGGIKVVTAVVLVLFLHARIHSRSNVCVFGRTIPDQQVLDAMTIVGIVVGLAFVGGVYISAACGVTFIDGLFETVSAIATVGVTANVTGKLNLVGRILIILYMYFGRVGVLTLSIGFLTGNRAEERYRYAYTNLLIG